MAGFYDLTQGWRAVKSDPEKAVLAVRSGVYRGKLPLVSAMAGNALNAVINRLTVGGSSLVTAIGGMVAFVAWGLAFAFAMAGTNREALVGSIVIGFLSGVAVVYDCGKRILAAESLATKDADRDALSVCLRRLEQRIVELREMEFVAPGYIKELNHDNVDESTKALLQDIRDTLERTKGLAAANLFTSISGVRLPNWNNLPEGASTAEYLRARTLAHLEHFAESLKKLI